MIEKCAGWLLMWSPSPQVKVKVMIDFVRDTSDLTLH